MILIHTEGEETAGPLLRESLTITSILMLLVEYFKFKLSSPGLQNCVGKLLHLFWRGVGHGLARVLLDGDNWLATQCKLLRLHSLAISGVSYDKVLLVEETNRVNAFR